MHTSIFKHEVKGRSPGDHRRIRKRERQMARRDIQDAMSNLDNPLDDFEPEEVPWYTMVDCSSQAEQQDRWDDYWMDDDSWMEELDEPDI
jgi:hypothetical protein